MRRNWRKSFRGIWDENLKTRTEKAAHHRDTARRRLRICEGYGGFRTRRIGGVNWDLAVRSDLFGQRGSGVTFFGLLPRSLKLGGSLAGKDSSELSSTSSRGGVGSGGVGVFCGDFFGSVVGMDNPLFDGTSFDEVWGTCGAAEKDLPQRRRGLREILERTRECFCVRG